MKPWKKSLLLGAGLFMAGSALAACSSRGGKDKYTADGKLKVSIRNLYFDIWGGEDTYTDYIEDKFKLDITPSSFSYTDWNTQVSGMVNANNLTDVFQFNVTQFNFANSYKYWVEGDIIKALPNDLSKWPNLKSLIEGSSDLDALKIDGKLYGIPVAKNLSARNVDYSPFTYVYRRDWAKRWGVYQENDDYTWEQFLALIAAFNTNLHPNDKSTRYAMADVEWGFPSLTNFYKDSPHCFSYDESKGEYVNTFMTAGYKTGRDLAKDYVTKKIYGYDQFSATEGGARKAYCSQDCGILYENLSLSNYSAIRKGLKTANGNDKQFNVDDASAIMKVKGPDGKYALEGTDNWFSLTLFNSDISDEKMNCVLDMMDYLLSEEGTKLAVYGKQGYDYTVDESGDIALTEIGWPKDDNGEYGEKLNGAKYLRYMASLGNEYASYDPLTDKTAFSVLNKWSGEMENANKAGSLRVFKERPEVMWLSTPLKDKFESSLLDGANDEVIRYCYSRDDSAAYDKAMSNDTWTKVLAEINKEVKK